MAGETAAGLPAGAERRRVSFFASARFSWLILGCIALLYAGVSFSPAIFDDNEGLYAGAVREMRQSGDWLVPTSNGFPRVQKPPLVYWAMLVSTAVLGMSEFTLRLPNALASAGWIVANRMRSRRRMSASLLSGASSKTCMPCVAVCRRNRTKSPSTRKETSAAGMS